MENTSSDESSFATSSIHIPGDLDGDLNITTDGVTVSPKKAEPIQGETVVIEDATSDKSQQPVETAEPNITIDGKKVDAGNQSGGVSLTNIRASGGKISIGGIQVGGKVTGQIRIGNENKSS
jgi:hypothetical protein